MLNLLYVSEKLLWNALAPSTLLLLMAWIGILLQRRHRRAGTICLVSALGLFTLIAVLPIGLWLELPLENRFPTVRVPPPGITGVIVLGGAVSPDISQARGIPTLNDDAERMTAMAYLGRRYPNAILAFTGGNGELVHGSMTEADVAREIFAELGLDPNRIVYESRSRTTLENVMYLKAKLNPQPGQSWLLVTSAWHMPRSVGLFRKAGWQVLPYPVAYKTASDLATELHGSVPERLEMFERATHEWVGLTVYWLLGHTSALFPGPQNAG